MKIIDKIKEIFEDEINYEQKFKDKIFYEVINSLFIIGKTNINITKKLFKENYS